MNETAGQRIKKRRKELGYNQAEFARLVGMAQSSLSEIERGESNLPNSKNMKKICEVLQVTPSWILTGEDGQLRYPTDIESDLLTELRKLTAEQQTAIYQIVRGMVKE
jgi:transcriptional regulator with XRE-family HTH domain